MTRRFDKGGLVAEPLGDIMSKGTPSMGKSRRPPLFVAAGAVKIPSTSRKVFVHHVTMAPLQRCAHTVGQRRLTAPDSF